MSRRRCALQLRLDGILGGLQGVCGGGLAVEDGLDSNIEKGQVAGELRLRRVGGPTCQGSHGLGNERVVNLCLRAGGELRRLDSRDEPNLRQASLGYGAEQGLDELPGDLAVLLQGARVEEDAIRLDKTG